MLGLRLFFSKCWYLFKQSFWVVKRDFLKTINESSSVWEKVKTFSLLQRSSKMPDLK